MGQRMIERAINVAGSINFGRWLRQSSSSAPRRISTEAGDQQWHSSALRQLFTLIAGGEAPRFDELPVVSLYFVLFFVFLVDVVDVVDLFCVQAAAGTRHDNFLVLVVIWAEAAVGDNGLLVEVLAMLGSGQGRRQ